MFTVKDGFFLQKPKIQGVHFSKRRRWGRRYLPIIVPTIIIVILVAIIGLDIIRCRRQIETACAWADEQTAVKGGHHEQH